MKSPKPMQHPHPGTTPHQPSRVPIQPTPPKMPC